MKRRYKAGDWFRIPLPGRNDALGIIARADRSRLYGYFFSVERSDSVAHERLKQLRPSDAVLARFFGGAGLEERRWPILATSLALDPGVWSAPNVPSPHFATPDQLEDELRQRIAGIPPETPLAVYEVKTPLDASSFATLDGGGRLQFSEPLREPEYERLSAFLQSRPNIELRIHGAWAGGFNAALLERFPMLRAVMLETPQVRNAQAFAALRNLISFRAAVEDGMNLEALAEVASLRSIDLRGLAADVEAPTRFAHLEDLRLTNTRSVPFGSSACKERLQNLALRHGVYDLSQIASLPALERLQLQDMRLERLPGFSANPNLHTLVLRDLRDVRDLRPILTAPALRRLTIEGLLQLEVADFAPLIDRVEGMALSIDIGSKTKSREVYRMLRPGRTR